MSLDKNILRPRAPVHGFTIVRYTLDIGAGVIVTHTWVYYETETPFEEVVPGYRRTDDRPKGPGVSFLNQWLYARSDRPPEGWERASGWNAWLGASLDDDNTFEALDDAGRALLPILDARETYLKAELERVWKTTRAIRNAR